MESDNEFDGWPYELRLDRSEMDGKPSLLRWRYDEDGASVTLQCDGLTTDRLELPYLTAAEIVAMARLSHGPIAAWLASMYNRSGGAGLR